MRENEGGGKNLWRMRKSGGKIKLQNFPNFKL